MKSKSIYYLTKALDACFYYRVVVPSKYLEREFGWKCYFDVIDAIFEVNFDGSYDYSRIKPNRMKILEEVGIVVIQRGTDEGHLQFVEFLRNNLKKVVIYEADDNYINVPDWNTGYRYFAPRAATIKRIISACDAMTVTVQNLADVYKPYNEHVHVIKNTLDFEKVDESMEFLDTDPMLTCTVYKSGGNLDDRFKEQARAQAANILKSKNGPGDEVSIQKLMQSGVYFNLKVHFDEYLNEAALNKDATVIGWGGSPTHVLDLEMVKKPLLEVMNRYKRTHLTMVGFTYMLKALNTSPFGVVLRKWLAEFDLNRFWCFNLVPVKSYYSLYRSLKFDIGIAPVASVEFNKGKSNLKIIELMGLSVYPMATKFDTYNGTIDKEGGMDQNVGRGRLSANEEEWKKNFYEVLNDRAMREESIAYNYEFVKQNYNIKHEVVKWNRFYSQFL